MTKQQAGQIWDHYVESTAKAWHQEFGEQSLNEEWTTTAFEDIPGAVVETVALNDPWRQFHTDVGNQLQTLITLAGGMDSRTPYEYNTDMCAAINREFDRLGWSSDTAPAGDTCLDAFPTKEAGIVAVCAEETMIFDSQGLYRALADLKTPSTYETVWQAMLPHRRES